MTASALLLPPAVMSSRPVARIGIQAPRLRSVPAYSATLGPEAVDLMTAAGQILDPWQSDVVCDILAVEPWARLMQENTPKRETRGLPVFIAQGSADTIVHPSVTANFIRDLCRSGTPVSFVGIPGGDHDASAIRGARHAARWIAARFRGREGRNNCGSPLTFQ